MRPRTSRWHATVGRPHRPAARRSPLAMPSVIVAEQLTKWYGPRLAVDRVSLEVEAGEVMGLLGPNGSGKTTILRILTGYVLPSSGTARIADLDVVDDALAARAHLGDPALLILDEPTNGLDPRQIIEMRGHIRALAGERTVLVTSHILGEIERVADRAAILLEGRLLGVR